MTIPKLKHWYEKDMVGFEEVALSILLNPETRKIIEDAIKQHGYFKSPNGFYYLKSNEEPKPGEWTHEIAHPNFFYRGQIT